jgi:hypothetical protein
MIAQATAAGPLRADPSKRVNYTLGLVLGVDEFQQDQLYHAAGRRWHNRLLHGYGTVWGLKVEAPQAGDQQPEIRVGAGVAVDPCGREICVPDTMCVKLGPWLTRHKASLQQIYGDAAPQGLSIPVAVVLCHRECPDDAVPVPGEPCRSQEDAMQPSRIRETFELRLALRDDAPWGSPPPENTTGLHTFRVSQPEEEVVREFGKLLQRVKVTEFGEGEEDLYAAVRALEDYLSGVALSPPQGTGPIAIPASRSAEILREAFRIWVTEVRPAIRDQEHEGDACGTSAGGECCVYLASVDVPVTTQWAPRDETVDVDETERPYLLHTRLLQEWLLASEDEYPDVDRFATLEILGPRRIRVWLHHQAWLDLPPEAVRLLINDADATRRIDRIDYAYTRNVWDIVLTGSSERPDPAHPELRDGDALELHFDSRRIPLVEGAPAEEAERLRRYETEEEARELREKDEIEAKEAGERPRFARWVPSEAARTGTVADELRAEAGEYLDRHGWTLRAYTLYDKLQGGDLDREDKFPKVVKIQGHPVDDALPKDDEYLRWEDNPTRGEPRWIPQVLPDGTLDLKGRYPGCTVVGLLGAPIVTHPEELEKGDLYLRFDGTNWVAAALPDGEVDVDGIYPDLTVVRLQNQPVSKTQPEKGHYLQWEIRDGRGQWAPLPLPEGKVDVTGTYPDLTVTGLHGKQIVIGAGQLTQRGLFLAWNGENWVLARPTAGGDAEGEIHDLTVTGLLGFPIEMGSPNRPGDYLRWAGDAWEVADIEQLQGRAVAPRQPNPGEVLTWNGQAQQWAPAPPQGGGGVGTLGGDAAGPAGDNVVGRLQKRNVSPDEPAHGDVLTWDNEGKVWRPLNPAQDSEELFGDVIGSRFSTSVVALRNRALADLAPNAGDFLAWNAQTQEWTPRQAPAGGGTGDLNGDVAGPSDQNQIQRLAGHMLDSTGAFPGQVLRVHEAGDDWRGAFVVDGPEAPYAIVAGGHFRVPPGSRVETVSVTGGLQLDFVDFIGDNSRIFQLILPELVFEPEKFTYLVKGTAAGHVVMLWEQNQKGPMIELARISGNERSDLHLEVSRFPKTNTFIRR